MISAKNPYRTTHRLALLATVGLALNTAPARAKVNVLTQHNDNARTGANLSETALNVSNVNANQFGKVFSRSVDSLIWTQPLVLTDVATSAGARDLVFVGTENATMYAFDATNKDANAPIWQNSLIPAGSTSGHKGIVGTPVIDAASKTLYVVSRTQGADGKLSVRLYALDVATGQNKAGSPVLIQGSVPGTGVGSAGGVQTFNPEIERQRPGLLLQNGTLYIAFGASNSEQPTDVYYGWLFSYKAATLQQTGIWCGAPDGLGATLWASGQGPAGDGGSIYVMTGNGKFSASTGGKDYGDSFLRFSVPGTAPGPLNVATYFTPFDEKDMERYDQDLGSSGPMLLPGTNLVIGAGKKGTMYVVNRTTMGGHRLDNDSQIVQSFPAFNGHFHGSPVVWTTPSNGTVVYGWSEEDQLKAFKFANGLFQTTPIQRSTMSVPPGMPGGFLSISASGTAPGTGILWAYHPFDGDANTNPTTTNGILQAFDANDITKELWNSRQNLTRDDLGKYAKFNYVTIANGKVYVPTFSAKLVVYGALSAPTVPLAPANLAATPGDAKVTLTWSAATNAASYTLKRGAATTGPFTTIASNLTSLNYVNTGLTNGTTYYYVVTASNAAGESANSNVASAKPMATVTSPTAGISIDFVGGGPNGNPTPMAPAEAAGVVKLSNWNQATGNTGSKSTLLDSSGVATSAAANWSAHGTYSTPITEGPGDARMMKGYLNTDATTATTVTISSLPANFASSGYDVYLYCDGSNSTATRTGTYALSPTTISATDAPNADFNGTFTQAANSNGNYVRFNNLTASGFTITATPGAATDPNPRAPVNGIQIVVHGAQATAPSVAITAPAANSALKSILEVKGTTRDNSGAGLARVELTLWHVLADGVTREYWNGTAWASTSAILTTTYTAASGTWTRNSALPAGSLLRQGAYGVTAKAVDNGNRSTTVQGAFVVDTTVPSVTISSPANGSTLTSLTSASGTASDNAGGSGLSQVIFYITRSSDGFRWSYTAWVNSNAGLRTVLSGNTWTCNQSLPPDSALAQGTYTLKAVAYDRAGNAGTSAISTITISRPAAMRTMQNSSIRLSSATAHADEDKVQLVFTGPLNSASAGDKTNFAVVVDGQSVVVEGVAYDPDSASVLVVLPPGSIEPGASVQVRWSDLRDLNGALVAGQTGIIGGQ